MNDFDDTCDHCGVEYNFTKGRDVIVMYMLAPYCSHVAAICPACDTLTRIYCTPDGLIHILSERGLVLQLGKYPENDIIEASRRVWKNSNLERYTPMPTDDLPIQRYLVEDEIEIPHQLLRELYDQMREFENDETTE